MALCGPRSGKDSFKIHAGDHVFKLRVLVGLKARRIKSLKTRSKNDGPDVQFKSGFFLFEIDGVVFTKFLTGLTFAFLACVDGFKVKAMTSVDGVLKRNGLGKRYIDGLAFAHAEVEGVGDFFGTFSSANAAPNALVFINIARMLDYLYMKVSYIPADAVYFSQSDEVDVGMPADLDQFR
jgi:hypothetical protein